MSVFLTSFLFVFFFYSIPWSLLKTLKVDLNRSTLKVHTLQKKVYKMNVIACKTCAHCIQQICLLNRHPLSVLVNVCICGLGVSTKRMFSSQTLCAPIVCTPLMKCTDYEYIFVDKWKLRTVICSRRVSYYWCCAYTLL